MSTSAPTIKYQPPEGTTNQSLWDGVLAYEGQTLVLSRVGRATRMKFSTHRSATHITSSRGFEGGSVLNFYCETQLDDIRGSRMTHTIRIKLHSYRPQGQDVSSARTAREEIIIEDGAIHLSRTENGAARLQKLGSFLGEIVGGTYTIDGQSGVITSHPVGKQIKVNVNLRFNGQYPIESQFADQKSGSLTQVVDNETWNTVPYVDVDSDQKLRDMVEQLLS